MKVRISLVIDNMTTPDFYVDLPVPAGTTLAAAALTMYADDGAGSTSRFAQASAALTKTALTQSPNDSMKASNYYV